MPVWQRGEEQAWLTGPFLPQELAITALGNSRSTGAKGIEGEVAYFASFDALAAAPAGAVQDRIVFIDHQMKPTQDGRGYGLYGHGRFVGPKVASHKRALGVGIRSIGPDNTRKPPAAAHNLA